MGFSLLNFFKDLEDAINDSAYNDHEKIVILKEMIADTRIYAKECGAIDE